MERVRRRPGEDDAIQETQVRLERVHRRALLRGSSLDPSPQVDEPGRGAGLQGDSQRPGLAEEVERAAERHVAAQGADTGHVHGHAGAEHERRHVAEGDPAHPAARALGGDRHPAGGRVEADLRRVAVAAKQPGVQERRAERHHGVAAHGAVPLVVEEEHAEVAVGGHRFGEDGAVHVTVSPRLVHQPRAHPVEVVAEMAALGQDRRPGNGRQPGGDDPQRLAGGVGVQRLDHRPPFGRLPIPMFEHGLTSFS